VTRIAEIAADRRAYAVTVIGRRGFLACTAALACGPGRERRPRATASPRLPETRDTLEALIAAWREKSPIVGLSVALVCDGELAWASGHGLADRTAGPETVYAIGSLTKPYTALATLRAVAAGQLDLDAPIRRHLPELRSGGVAAETITARHLLCHRSGLPSDWHRGGLGSRPPPWTGVIDEIADEPAIAAPDSWTAYSNIGYTLLGHALTRATGRDFEELLQEAMAAELGAAAPRLTPPIGLLGHIQGRPLPEPQLRHAPAAGLHASVLDLVPLLRFLTGPSPLAAMMLTPQRTSPIDLDEVWGLGLALRHVGLDYAGRVGFHAGRTFTHRSALCVLPDHGLAIAVLANSREASGVEELAISTLQTALLERHGIDLPASTGDGEVPAAAAAAMTELRAHAGRYAGEADVIDLEVEGAGLVSRSEAGEVALTPALDGCFNSSGNRDARVRVRTVAGRRVLTSRVRAVESRVAVGCLQGHVPEDWWQRLGRYRVAAPADEVLAVGTVTLERLGDDLSLRLDASRAGAPALARFMLHARDAVDARIDGIGRGKGQRVLADRDGALHWAGYRLVRES
jgi:CubicO group peptidase (beta-lactamase class C family)